jgi:hypothetical protein
LNHGRHKGGGSRGGSKNRRRRRIKDHTSRAIAIAGDAPPWIHQFLAEMKQMFGDLMINLTLNNMIDGQMLKRSMGKYQLKKVSVFI